MLKITRFERDLLLQKFPYEYFARAGKRYGRKSDYFCTERPSILAALEQIRSGKSAAQMPKEDKIDGIDGTEKQSYQPAPAGSRPQATGSRAEIRQRFGSSTGSAPQRSENRVASRFNSRTVFGRLKGGD